MFKFVVVAQDMHQSAKSKHHQSGGILPQKRSPLDSIGPGASQKAPVFESRTCKQLLNETFSKVDREWSFECMLRRCIAMLIQMYSVVSCTDKCFRYASWFCDTGTVATSSYSKPYWLCYLDWLHSTHVLLSPSQFYAMQAKYYGVP